jgi:flagellar hook protein FlgE
MLGVIGNSLSSIRANTRGFVTNAQNIANIATEDYRPSRTTFESLAGGGVEASVEEASDGAGGVDLAQETIEMISRQRAIEANLKVIQASEKTLGVLIDTIG